MSIWATVEKRKAGSLHPVVLWKYFIKSEKVKESLPQGTYILELDLKARLGEGINEIIGVGGGEVAMGKLLPA